MSTERREPTFNASAPISPREIDAPKPEPRRETVKTPPHYAPAPALDSVPAKGNGLAIFALLIGLVASVLAGFLYWQLTETKKVLTQADARISGLEQQLSLTSEESTASVVTLQANLKKLDADLQKVSKQAETNRVGLAEASKKIATAETGVAQLKKDSAGVVSGIAALKKEMATQKTVFDTASGKIDTVATAITQQQQQQQSLSDEIAKLRMEMVDAEALNVRLKKTEESIKAIDDYRRTTNREILQIKQQINGVN